MASPSWEVPSPEATKGMFHVSLCISRECEFLQKTVHFRHVNISSGDVLGSNF